MKHDAKLRPNYFYMDAWFYNDKKLVVFERFLKTLKIKT